MTDIAITETMRGQRLDCADLTTIINYLISTLIYSVSLLRVKLISASLSVLLERLYVYFDPDRTLFLFRLKHFL